jgi:MFS superfamily sulfate permease-like transporter
VESLSNAHQINWFALFFFIASYAFLFTMQKRNGKIPWSIVLAAIGIVIGAVQEAMSWSVQLATIKSRYGELEMSLVQIPALFSDGLDVPFSAWIHILQGSISIAIVAVLETLISAHIADRMTKTLFDQRKEVLAIAICNAASGMAGGIPATAALARTALNVKSGATSRGSGIINGLSIILLSTALFGMFKYLPLPVVAAILVNVAMRMVEWPEVKLLYKMDKPMFLVAIISALICIIEDPTLGIVAGAFLAMIRVLMQKRNAHALLRIYRGTNCRLNYLFDGVDIKKSVQTCRAKFTNEPTPEEIAAEVATTAHPLAVLDRVEANIELHHQRELDLARRIAEKGTVEGARFSPKPTEDVNPLHAHAHPEGHSHKHGDGTDVATKPKKPSKAERRAARKAAAMKSGRRPSAVEEDLYHMETDPRDAVLPYTAVYMLPGYFTYVSAQAHRDRCRALFMEGASSLPDIKVVVFSLVETYFADPDALETIGILVEELRRSGHEVYMLGFHVKVLKPLSKSHFFHELRHFTEYPALLQFMRDQVNEEGVYVAAPAPGGHGAHGPAGHAAPAGAPAPALPDVDVGHKAVSTGVSSSSTAQKRGEHVQTAPSAASTSAWDVDFSASHPASQTGGPTFASSEWSKL